jgi:purine-binding chemotaxis protein CheW
MMEPYVLFEVADTTYAVPVTEVQSVEMVDSVTRVPNAPEYVDGLVYLRGQVLPVVSLRRRLGLERVAHDLATRIVVVRVGERRVGLLVDSARTFTQMDSDAVLPAADVLAVAQDVVRGLIKWNDRLVLILDVPRVLAPLQVPADTI